MGTDTEQTIYRLESLLHDAASFDGRMQAIDDRTNGTCLSFEDAAQSAFKNEVQNEYRYEATFWAGYALEVLNHT